jgi:hypothetical protein
MRKLLTVVTVAAIALLGVSAAQAKGPGGNSANAKLCQKGGWQTMVGADGTAFASEQECVSFAAQGGTIVPKSGAQLKCEELGGEFRPDLAALNPSVVWVCRFVESEILGNPPSYLTGRFVAEQFRNFCVGELVFDVTIGSSGPPYTHLACVNRP